MKKDLKELVDQYINGDNMRIEDLVDQVYELGQENGYERGLEVGQENGYDQGYRSAREYYNPEVGY